LTADKTTDGDDNDQALHLRPNRSSVLALASGIRTCLRLHQQLGVVNYPRTPGLQQFLVKKTPPPAPGGYRHKVPHAGSPPRKEQQSSPAYKSVVPADQFATVHRDIGNCRLCPLASARQGQVIGSGDPAARLLIVGDYCSQQNGFLTDTLFSSAEDAMLWNMMRAIGLVPQQVYVTNTIKCCPLADRQPAIESEQQCRAYLRREIELVRPRIICAMGEVAARSVLGAGEPLFRLRGRFHPYPLKGEGYRIQVMVTFHPRFLLANADFKKTAWQDLQMIQRQLQMS
jgi:DNA polymerase